MPKPTINIKIFALDDDEFIRDQIKEALDNASIANYTMFDHHVGFFRELDEHVNIAIIDHRLDGMTGLEVMRKLKETNPWCYVIIISGMVDMDIVVDYLNEGADKFIPKNKKQFTSLLIKYVNDAYYTLIEARSIFMPTEKTKFIV